MTVEKQRAANRKSYYKHHAERRVKANECHRRLRSDPEWRAKEREERRKQYAANLEERRKYHRQWRIKRGEKERQRIRNYMKRHREEDPLCRLRICLRSRLKVYLRGKKSESTRTLIGCTYGFLKNHLEEQFKPGMTWENRGMYGWHVDHIVPMSWFGDLLRDPEWQKVACHWTNLQPLWRVENQAKMNRYAG